MIRIFTRRRNSRFLPTDLNDGTFARGAHDDAECGRSTFSCPWRFTSTGVTLSGWLGVLEAKVKTIEVNLVKHYG